MFYKEGNLPTLFEDTHEQVSNTEQNFVYKKNMPLIYLITKSIFVIVTNTSKQLKKKHTVKN